MNQLGQVIGAIETFYAPNTPAPLRLATGKSLESFQNTVYAWNASVELLKTSDNPCYALFAAQTLKHKIVLDWRQLEDVMAVGLRETLWAFCFHGAALRRVATVSVQLKLALAALIAQMPFNLWADPVGDLFGLVQERPEVISDVLEVLALIPEQLNNRSIQFASNDLYYEKCALLLEKHIDPLIQMILRVLQSPLEDRLRVSKDLLACLLAWIQFGGNGSKIIESSEFLNGLFALLHTSCAAVCGKCNADAGEEEDLLDEGTESNLQVIEIACELLVELVARMSGRIDDWDDNADDNQNGSSNNNSDWFKRLDHGWIPTLSSNLCRLPVIRSLQMGNESSLQRSLVTLLSESMELFLVSLMERREEFLKLCEIILGVAESPRVSASILELTFNFWAALPAELASFDGDADSSSNVEERQEPFLYLFARLFAALLEGPLVFRAGGSAEDIDKFREFRHTVGDCLKDCVRVLGSTEALILVHRKLIASEAGQREAALFALRTISSSVDPRESEVMPQIAPLLLSILEELLQQSHSQSQSQLPTHLKMVSAVVLNVGCYAEWLRYHSEFMGLFLQIISVALDYSLNSGSSVVAIERPSTVIGSSLQSLKYMCDSCAGLLGPQYPALEGLFSRVYPWNGLCRRDRLDLTEAVALVLSRRTLWSENEFMAALQRLVQLIWSAGPAGLEDYAVVLECTMLPELPRTPLIFSQIFMASFAMLAEAFLSSTANMSGEDEEKFCEAWQRVIQAAINNGTAGSVGELVNGPLQRFLLDVCEGGRIDQLSPAKQATLYSVCSSLISGQLVDKPEAMVVGLLSSTSSFSASQMAKSEIWTSERCNLLRVCILYVFTRPTDLQAFLLQSKSFDLLNDLLQLGRILSSLEIVSLCGFLGSLFGALQEDFRAAFDPQLLIFLEGVIVRCCEAGLLEWPLTHIHDLAMLLSKSARDASLFKSLVWSLLDPTVSENILTTRLPFSPETSTPAELAALARDYPLALAAACKNFRPKNLRLFLKSLAETCRRRRNK